MLSRQTIINISIVAWVVLSVIYIGYDLFSKFTVNVMQKSYVAGQTDTVNGLINEAKKGCDGFKVYSGDKEVTLLNVDCLKGNQQQSSQNGPSTGDNK